MPDREWSKVPRPDGCQADANPGRADFACQIRLALENLHDYAFLQKLPLTDALGEPGGTLDQTVRRLRADLLQAIEQLCPAKDVLPRAKERRPYALLFGRYVQGMSTAELVEELAISVRQLRREQQRALDAVTRLMWDRLAPRLQDGALRRITLPPANGEAPGLALDEAQQPVWQGQAEYLPLSSLVQGVLAVVQPVAGARGINLHNQLPDDLPTVQVDRVIFRQGLMELVAWAMDWAAQGDVTIGGSCSPDARLWIRATGGMQAKAAAGQVRLDVSRRLIESQGGRLTVAETPQGRAATVALPIARDVSILVVDDNQGLVELFRRYLAGQHYQVVSAATADEAIRQAREASPRLIILDIMVPQQDGWEILQRLRAVPESRHIPVVVCSVLNEPEIAAGLGAAGYLTKPVTQDALLTMVERHCRPAP
jgi:CheY-like chemotaxis protein